MINRHTHRPRLTVNQSTGREDPQRGENAQGTDGREDPQTNESSSETSGREDPQGE